jgi:oligopeptide transport system permease protein
MTITGWGGMARLVRGQVLQLKEQQFVLAAKALGASPARIIGKHLLPNAAGVIIAEFTLDIPLFIFGEAFLSFIGLGIQSPGTSWGAMAASAQQHLMFYPYQIFFPSLFISLTMLSFNLLGDGLRDAADPRLSR